MNFRRLIESFWPCSFEEPKKTFDNAEKLYFEAEFLAAAGAIARALCLHQISLEECSKVENLGAWITSLLSGLPVNQEKVLATFRRHSSKNKSNAYMLEGSEAESEAKARGDWKAASEESIGDRLAFRRSWLRRTGMTAEKNLTVIINRGDSNSPDINHSDAMLVDRGVQQLRDNAFYVFDRAGLLLVKMIERLVDGRVILKSRNPGYDAQTLSPEEAAGLTVYGRVLWRGGLL